jgi:hypothetical protein
MPPTPRSGATIPATLLGPSAVRWAAGTERGQGVRAATDEQPEFKWRAEAEEAVQVLCPLHGRRLQTVVTRHIYQAQRFGGRTGLRSSRRP